MMILERKEKFIEVLEGYFSWMAIALEKQSVSGMTLLVSKRDTYVVFDEKPMKKVKLEYDIVAEKVKMLFEKEDLNCEEEIGHVIFSDGFVLTIKNGENKEKHLFVVKKK